MFLLSPKTLPDPGRCIWDPSGQAYDGAEVVRGMALSTARGTHFPGKLPGRVEDVVDSLRSKVQVER